VAMLVRVVNQHAKAVEDGVATRFTLPENPLTLVTVTTVCLSDPTGMEMRVALSAIVKSEDDEFVTVTVTLTECEVEPLVPVTVTV
jgi:hypothetical protein